MLPYTKIDLTNRNSVTFKLSTELKEEISFIDNHLPVESRRRFKLSEGVSSNVLSAEFILWDIENPLNYKEQILQIVRELNLRLTSELKTFFS
ncbi:MAG: hypothetical protein ABJI69_00710 [Balneola sp.]